MLPMVEHSNSGDDGNRKVGTNCLKTAKDDYEDPDEKYLTDRETFEHLREEGLKPRKVPPHIKHVDVPFRPIFAALMKDVPDKEERVKAPYYFYISFADNLSK